MRRLLLPLLAVLAASAASGCGDGLAPLAGTLEVTLDTPNSDDGAVLFVVAGGPIDQVDPAGYLTYSAPIGLAGTRVVVTGNLAPGVLVHLRVPDIHRAGSYTVVLEQVAARAPGYPLRPLGGYRATVTP
ncbi:MAG: hypothetical protein ACREMO_02150 [Gemmatimonadales bacterium]